MKTNQDMIINIGNNHTIKIGHLTKMGGLWEKLSILDTRSYNLKEHTSRVREKRAEYQKYLQQFIQVGVLKNVDNLIYILKKLKLK